MELAERLEAKSVGNAGGLKKCVCESVCAGTVCVCVFTLLTQSGLDRGGQTDLRVTQAEVCRFGC